MPEGARLAHPHPAVRLPEHHQVKSARVHRRDLPAAPRGEPQARPALLLQEPRVKSKALRPPALRVAPVVRVSPAAPVRAVWAVGDFVRTAAPPARAAWEARTGQ